MKHTPTLLRSLAFLALLGLAGCATAVKVDTKRDPAATFSGYRTYTVAPGSGQALSAASEAVLRDTLRTSLAEKGITEASTGKGDLAVVSHVFVRDVVKEGQSGTPWGFDDRDAWSVSGESYGMWRGAPSAYGDPAQFTSGTLVLDVVDTKTKRLVFRGQGEAVVGSQESNARKIRDAVQRIVAEMPATGR
jgi:hypothetical protein